VRATKESRGVGIPSVLEIQRERDLILFEDKQSHEKIAGPRPHAKEQKRGGSIKTRIQAHRTGMEE